MRVQLALSVALILLIIGTASSATATETSSTTSSDLALTPITLSLISGDAEAAAGGPITGPGSASAAAASILEDPGAPPVPANARRVQPVAERVTVAKPKPKPRPKATHHARSAPVRITGHVLRGAASWYCNSDRSRGPISACHYAYPDTGAFNAYAAAGPRLRAAMGSWRGRIVSVDGLRVKLVDWCQCYKGQSNEKLIDLYRDVYGVVGGSVTIRW